MGLDLALVPKLIGPKDYMLANCRLPLQRDRELFARLGQRLLDDPPALVTPQPLAPIRFENYEDDGLKQVANDPYGSPLTWLPAGEFAKLHSARPWNQAVLVLMAALPPETIVVLWWH